MLTELRLADGSVLEYAEYGDSDGVPVVLQPGTPGTSGVGTVVAEGAKRHGVRLLAVSRPGYGGSTLTPPGLASVAEQVGLAAGALGLHRFAVWGLSGGGPFALAQAAVTPHRVTRVVVAAGPAGDEQAEDADSLTAEAIELGARLRGLDDEEVAAAMAEQTPPDERYFEDHPEHRSAFFADLRRGVARPEGYVRDNLSWGGPWDVTVETLAVRVDLIYGQADQMVPLDNGERLASLIPDADLRVLPGAGHGEATFGSADLALRLLTGESTTDPSGSSSS